MDLSVWLALMALFLAGGLTPGPAVMMVMSASLRYGAPTALIPALGVSAANLVWITLAATGIAATAVFCFIIAWTEYAFALIMTRRTAQTAPPFIPSQVGSGLPDWTVIAAGTFLFLLPVAIFTFLLRNHLLRGMSFGAIRK